VADLKTKELAFIDYYNQTMAKPFKWTYQGKPFAVKRRADFRALSFQSKYAMMKQNYCKKGNKTMPATRFSMWHLVVSRKNG
jgi:hypothetical protein